MKKIKKFWAMMLSLVIVFVSMFQSVSAFADYKEQVLKENKPLSSKIGGLVYPYYQKKEYVRTQVNALHIIGMHYARVSAEFDSKTIVNGKFDIGSLEYAVKEIQKQHMVPLIYFGGQGGESFPKDLDPEQTRNLITQVIDTFKNQGVVWESWNEPNQTFWIGDKLKAATDAETINGWVTMDKYIAGEINRLDSNSPYIVGNLAGNLEDNQLTLGLANQAGLFSVGDAISFHPYPLQVVNNGRPENLANSMRPSLVSLSRKLPIVTSEIGYSLKNHSNYASFGRSDWLFDWQGLWSQAEQKDYLLRSLLILDSMKEPIISTFSTSFDNYSITKSDGRLTSTGKAIKNLLGQLKDYTFKKDLVSNTQNNSKHVFLYTKGKQEKIVYWTSNGTADVVVKYKGKNSKYHLSETPQVQTLKNNNFTGWIIIVGIVALVGVVTVTIWRLRKRRVR